LVAVTTVTTAASRSRLSFGFTASMAAPLNAYELEREERIARNRKAREQALSSNERCPLPASLSSLRRLPVPQIMEALGLFQSDVAAAALQREKRETGHVDKPAKKRKQTEEPTRRSSRHVRPCVPHGRDRH